MTESKHANPVDNSPETSPKDISRSFGGQMVFYVLAEWIFRLRGFIIIPILSRLLGTQGYGLVSSLTSLGGLAQAAVAMGLSTAIKIFIPGLPQPQRQREFWGVLQVSTWLSIILVGGMLLFYSPIRAATLPNEMTLGLFIPGVLLIPVNTVHLLLRGQIVNQKESQAYSIIVSQTSVIEILLYIGGGLWAGALGVLYAMVFTLLLRNAMMIRLIIREDKFVLLIPNMLAEVQKYYVYGLSLMILSLASWVVNSSDRLIIGRFLGSAALGVYDVPYNITNRVNGIVPIFAALMPFVAEAVNTGKTEVAKRYLEGTYKVLLSIYVPVTIYLILNRLDIVLLLSSEAFIEGAAYMPFVAIGVVFWQLSGVYNYNIHAHKRGQLLIIPMVIAGLFNLGFNYLLVPRYGAVAAAISTALTFGLIFFMNRIISNRILKVRLDPQFLPKALISFLGFGATVWVTLRLTAPWHPIWRVGLSAATGGSVYLGLILLLKLFKPQEMRYFESLFRSLLPQLKKNRKV
ncbi:MAG: polysaccharide biosynthesis C-terminal domain-containing protein [Anaerolineales bacterium]